MYLRHAHYLWDRMVQQWCATRGGYIPMKSMPTLAGLGALHRLDHQQLLPVAYIARQPVPNIPPAFEYHRAMVVGVSLEGLLCTVAAESGRVPARSPPCPRRVKPCHTADFQWRVAWRSVRGWTHNVTDGYIVVLCRNDELILIYDNQETLTCLLCMFNVYTRLGLLCQGKDRLLLQP